jgi:hypothetical protein
MAEAMSSMQNENQDTLQKLMQCEAELQREREINVIARGYISDEMVEEFELALPNRQPIWTHHLSPVSQQHISSNRFDTHF